MLCYKKKKKERIYKGNVEMMHMILGRRKKVEKMIVVIVVVSVLGILYEWSRSES